MKLILLTATLLMFASRIKHTPSSLSYKRWRIRLEKYLNKSKSIDEKGEEYKSIVHGVATIFGWFLYTLLIIYYLVIGCKFPQTPLFVLSAIQVVTVSIHWKNELMKGEKVFSNNIADHEFKRWWNLFNVILDYAYYPMAIYMLMQ